MNSEDHHAIILNKLLDLTNRIDLALDQKKPAHVIDVLRSEHSDILQYIREVGISKNVEILNLAKNVNARVEQLTNKINNQKNEIRQRLLTMTKRKKHIVAYGG